LGDRANRTFCADPQAAFGYRRAAPVDTLPPPPPPQPAYVYAATDERPRGQRETELCAKASTPDWLGLTWGFTLGGGYLSIPKCSMDYVQSRPPEGDVRVVWPMAVAFAALAGVTAPIIEATEIGAPSLTWSDGERVTRVVLSSGLGVAGALLPYLLPPKTWRAARELERIRAGATADGRGAFVSWGVRF